MKQISQLLRIGSILVGLAFISYELGIEAAEIALRLTSIAGFELKSIAANTPFNIIVSIKDGEQIRQWPEVKGLDKVQVLNQRTEHNMQVVDQKQESVQNFIYTARATQTGELSLGPARATSAGTPLTSQAAHVHVIENIAKKGNAYAKPTYKLSLGRTKAVVGETIPFVVTFTYQDPDVKLYHIETPHDDGLVADAINSGQARDEIINNELYHVVEFRGAFHADTAKKIAIGRLKAEYTEPSHDRGWNGFFSFAGFQDRNAVYVEPVTIDIKTLPATSLHISGVGTFKKFSASLNTTEIPQGEAAVLTLELEGDGAESSLKAPELIMPQTIRAYESSSSSERIQSGIRKKWEFVVQGLEEGDVTIEPQQFHYYDTASRSYKTLTSKPLSLKITKPLVKPKAAISTTDDNQGKKTQREQGMSTDAQLLAQEDEQKKLPPLLFERGFPYEIPLSLFILLLLIPLFWRLGMLILASTWMKNSSVYLYSARKLRRLRNQWILWTALYRLRKLIKAKEYGKIYGVFKQTAIKLLDLPSYASDADIEQALVGALIRKVGSVSQSLFYDIKQLMQDMLSLTHFAVKNEKADKQTDTIAQHIDKWLRLLTKSK